MQKTTNLAEPGKSQLGGFVYGGLSIKSSTLNLAALES